MLGKNGAWVAGLGHELVHSVVGDSMAGGVGPEQFDKQATAVVGPGGPWIHAAGHRWHVKRSQPVGHGEARGGEAERGDEHRWDCPADDRASGHSQAEGEIPYAAGLTPIASKACQSPLLKPTASGAHHQEASWAAAKPATIAAAPTSASLMTNHRVLVMVCVHASR